MIGRNWIDDDPPEPKPAPAHTWGQLVKAIRAGQRYEFARRQTEALERIAAAAEQGAAR